MIKHTLVNYLLTHTSIHERPQSGSVDVIFFHVTALGEPDLETLKKLTAEYNGSSGTQINPYDNEERDYIKLSEWLGDKEAALRFMALSQLLGHGSIITPRVFGILNEDQILHLAEHGYISFGTDKELAKFKENSVLANNNAPSKQGILKKTELAGSR